MKLLKAKTTRLTQVIEQVGTPEAYTLWQKPAHDAHLQRLIKNRRIMTILKSEAGTEFGQADFLERKGATYLAFSKSLKEFAGHRIIGIKWDAVKS